MGTEIGPQEVLLHNFGLVECLEAGMPQFHLAYAVGTNTAPNDDRTDEFRDWLDRFVVHILNIAGNRESSSPGIQDFTRSFLSAALLIDD